LQQEEIDAARPPQEDALDILEKKFMAASDGMAVFSVASTTD